MIKILFEDEQDTEWLHLLSGLNRDLRTPYCPERHTIIQDASPVALALIGANTKCQIRVNNTSLNIHEIQVSSFFDFTLD